MPTVERTRELIDATANLSAGWDSYDADPPNDTARLAARRVLDCCLPLGLEPNVDASAEGGICLSFHRGERYGDVECFNTGEILAVTSPPDNGTDVWQVEDSTDGISRALRKLRDFIA